MSARRTSRIWADERSPGYTGPIVAALLSLTLGVFVAALLLAAQPVNRVKELPKPDAQVRGAVYWVEGNRDPARLRSAQDKAQLLLRGQLVTFSEEELNALLEAALAVKAKTPSDALVSPGTPNVRIRDGVVQLASELTFSLWGEKRKVVLQTRGTFHEYGGQWVFEPTQIFMGALPVDRVPFLGGWVRTHYLDPRALHPDLATAWSRLGRIVAEGNVIRVALR